MLGWEGTLDRSTTAGWERATSGLRIRRRVVIPGDRFLRGSCNAHRSQGLSRVHAARRSSGTLLKACSRTLRKHTSLCSYQQDPSTTSGAQCQSSDLPLLEMLGIPAHGIARVQADQPDAIEVEARRLEVSQQALFVHQHRRVHDGHVHIREGHVREPVPE